MNKRKLLNLFLWFTAGVGTSMLVKGYSRYSREAALQNVKDATYTILTRTSQGTGVVVRSDKNGSLLITNKHICIGSRQTSKELKSQGGVISNFVILFAKPKDEKPIVGQVIAVSQNLDLCAIHVAKTDLPSVTIAKNAVKAQQKIYTYGTPQGKEGTLEKGRVFGTRWGHWMRNITALIKVRPGASGSGVFNEDNELVGIVAMLGFSSEKAYLKNKNEPDLGLFVPLEHVKLFLAQFGITE